MMQNIFFYDFPIGRLGIAADKEAICKVFFSADKSTANLAVVETPLIQKAAKQLTEYFNRQRKNFELPIKVQGTDFQRAVWQAVQSIPFGKTYSYKEIAQLIGNPQASRAVGLANGCNPLAIIIPCHRVIGQNGKMTGYAG